MNVTLKDIAREAGVYPSLVSAVLNNGSYTRISPERRAAIKAIAARMGYRPNLQASSLRKGKKSLVGVFLPMWEDVLFIELIRGLSQEANELDIPLSFHFGMKPEHYEKFLKNTLEFRHTGIISYGFAQDDADEAARIAVLLEDYIKDGGERPPPLSVGTLPGSVDPDAPLLNLTGLSRACRGIKRSRY